MSIPENDELERLLARPALPADDGFTATVIAGLEKPRTGRYWLVAVAAVGCLLLAFLTQLPQSFYAGVLERTGDPQISTEISAMLTWVETLTTALLQAGLPVLIMTLVGIMALLSFAVSDHS